MLVELLLEYGMFLAKVATFLIAILIVIGAIVSASQKDRSVEQGSLKIKKVNDRLKFMEDTLLDNVLDPHARKALIDGVKKDEKEKAKNEKKKAKQLKKANTEIEKESAGKRVFVLDFDGDVKASDVERLRQEITGVLTLATSNDEVVVSLESPGGMVHAYGLAASQLERIKSAEVPLTICVDKVAASGGYMMACIADKLLAAPFAILGSIGVVASLPNFNRVLKKLDVDYELLTAGEYKRTLTMLGENTEEGRSKFVKDLEDTHELFKKFVSEYRPQLDIAKVATGETWYGQQAIDNNLIDAVSTSDSYITSLAKDADVYEVKYEEKRQWQERVGLSIQSALENSFDKLFSKLMRDWDAKH